MARFVFELEAVLQQRLAVERQKQLAVAALERERLALEETIRASQRGLVREKEEWRGRLSGAHAAAGAPGSTPGLDVRAIRLQAATTLQLNAKARQEVLRLAGVHQRLEGARRELLEAATRRKAVELLKSRRFQAWKTALARRESAELDELMVMRAGAAGGTSGDAM